MPPESLRIAYLLPDVHVSGGAAVVFQHANRLARRGHSVIVASAGTVSSTDWFPGQSVPVVKASDLPSDLDLLVATSWPTAFECLKYPARRHCYFVQSDETRFHEPGSPLHRAARLSYELDLNFLTEARWIRRWLAETFGKQAALVPNGLDPAIFYPDTPLEPKTDRPRVLLEGAIALPFKGMKEAFEAVAGLDVEVWCVSAYGRPGKGWRCDRFFESVPMETMRRLYSSCDVLVKLSRVEGFFGPPLEMMACGGLCVVGRVSGYDEYIRDGQNALVVEPDDIEGARNAVSELLSNRDLQETLRADGLKTAAAWDWETSVDALEAYFLEVEAAGRRADAAAETNEQLLTAYEETLSGPMSRATMLQTLAHRIKKRTNSQLLLRAGEAFYRHMLQHKDFYRKLLRVKF
jgi:glycosyltransferase involved in cell wall biosynthesis